MSPGPRAAGVGGLVPAAGRSSRMGRPKAFLEHHGSSFLERILGALGEAGAEPRVVVVAPGDRRLAAEAARLGAVPVTNPDPGRGMLSSVLAGLEALERHGVRAFLLWPVDHPLPGAATARALVEAHESSGAPLVLPCYRGEPGHPALFARALFAELRAAPAARGARAVVEAHGADRLLVPVEDPGVVVDIDTPGDLRALAGVDWR